MKKHLSFLAVLVLVFACTRDLEMEPIPNHDSSKATGTRASMDGEYDLLGYGYDVTGEYMTPASSRAQVIQLDSFVETGKINETLIKMREVKVHQGESSVHFVQNLSTSVNIGVSLYGFSGSIKLESMSSSDYKEQYSFAMLNETYLYNGTSGS